MHKAVILAGGRGTRMQIQHQVEGLTSSQSLLARTGVKAMIPVGRPFIDYTLSALADAGFQQICIVVGSKHTTIQDHCETLRPTRISLQFAAQSEPLGTAHALLAAFEFVGRDDFIVVNGDNYYPRSALVALRACDSAAVAAFTPKGLQSGNVPFTRFRSYAVLMPRPDATLERVFEKPALDQVKNITEKLYINMNCWRFTPRIFQACSSIQRSARQEFELTDAVNHAIDRQGERFRIIPIDDAVLDLSSRDDIPAVTQRLEQVEVSL